MTKKELQNKINVLEEDVRLLKKCISAIKTLVLDNNYKEFKDFEGRVSKFKNSDGMFY